MDKSPDAFRTISEVAEWLGVQTHVLRFWESKFSQVKPVKRAGGRRYYRPSDMQLLGGIKKLLHDDGMTIKGVQKLLREEGIGHVAGFSRALDSAAEATAADVGENVVRFTAKPEDEPTVVENAAVPEDAPAEPELDFAPEPETAEQEATPLPSFLTQPMGGTPEPAPKKPLIVDAPDPPAEADIAASSSALTYAARLSKIDPETAKAISPLISRLAVLRDKLGQASG